MGGREYRYKLSVAINEWMFDKAELIALRPSGPKSGLVAGTVYPAIQVMAAADNVAIWPNFADSCLILEWVRYVQIERYDAAGPSYAILNLAEGYAGSGGEIVWRDILGPEVSRRTFIGFEGGTWISRNGVGRVYYFH